MCSPLFWDQQFLKVIHFSLNPSKLISALLKSKNEQVSCIKSLLP